MTDTEARVIAAWKEAAADLRIRFTSPFIAPSGGGLRHEYLGLVHMFGGRTGTLIRVLREPSELSPEPAGDGYYWSVLSPGYGWYKRQFFIDTLEDWQFFGLDSDRPEWYSGRSGREIAS